MKNPLENLHQTLGIGAIVAVIILFIGRPSFDQAFWAAFFRWAHVIAGVLWIGILYYFNFVQMPSMPKIPDEQKPAVTKVIAPEALFWFRWAAAATVLFGLITAPKSARARGSRCRHQEESGASGDAVQPLQHDVLHRHAVLHGDGEIGRLNADEGSDANRVARPDVPSGRRPSAPRKSVARRNRGSRKSCHNRPIGLRAIAAHAAATDIAPRTRGSRHPCPNPCCGGDRRIGSSTAWPSRCSPGSR